ncbi:MAG: hypothetical protein QXM93_09495 [Candidatus Methanomethyliaceae archaeon]
MAALVPELHDIGKLIDKRSTGVEHNFENYPTQLCTNTWRGIVEHHCSANFQKYPSEIDTFKLCIADDLAAAVSRYSVEGEGLHVFNVYKLWKPPKEKLTQSFIKTKEGVEELIRFVAGNPNAKEFFARYRKILSTRAEDATAGRNITSLLTHSRLTGQFFRILLMDEKSFSIKSEEIRNLDRDKVAELIKKKKNEWKLSLIRFKFHFMQNPVRAKDLNVFRILENILNEIKKRFPDNVLFHTSDELLLISSRGKQILEDIFRTIEEWGFWSEIVYAEVPINSLKPRPEEISGSVRETKYPTLSKEIEPPICEICQMAKAAEQPWIDEESGIIEYICHRCQKVREMGSLLIRFVEWERAEQNPKVCWIKIWLDYETLIQSLVELYHKYLASLGIDKRQAEVRFSVISEFQEDYYQFLTTMWQRVNDTFGLSNIQKVLSDFISIRIESTNKIKSILTMYNKTFDEHFPMFKEVNSPVRLSIVCANAKFPFFEVWRLLCDAKRSVNVHLVGKGVIQLEVKDLDAFLKVRVGSKALLHKLVRISELSQKLAEITLYDRADRHFKKYEDMRIAFHKFGIQNMLTYIKMMGD